MRDKMFHIRRMKSHSLACLQSNSTACTSFPTKSVAQVHEAILPSITNL